MIKSKYYLYALRKGEAIELEHTKDRAKARKIAADHLKENLFYYKYAKPGKKGYKEYLISRRR